MHQFHRWGSRQLAPKSTGSIYALRQGAEYGYHPGGWGKPPVDEYSAQCSPKAVGPWVTGWETGFSLYALDGVLI